MFDMPTTKMLSEYIAGDLRTKLTVTEMQGGGGGDDEEDDEEDDESTDDGSDDSDSGSDDSGSDDSDDDADDRIMMQDSGAPAPGAVRAYAGPSQEDICATVRGAALDLIGDDQLEDDSPLMEAGLDSLAAV